MEAAQKAPGLAAKVPQLFGLLFVQVLQPMRDCEAGFELRVGAEGNRDVIAVDAFTSPTTTLGDVRRQRHSRPPNLAAQSKSFCVREGPRYHVASLDQTHRELPRLELLMR